MIELIKRLRTVAVTPCHEAADALEAQQAEIERLADELNAMKEWKDSMRDKMEALKAQAAKDAADAGRYRWLLTNAYVGIATYPKPHEVWCLRLPNPGGCENLDAAIDAAMKESQS